ncbi:carboxymuconolactone decarboxylase family protein [Tomitella gaofuii]|uniref:carboxymuconolactone decarboxylase family protein n=1 Tax=Tomitella gaofuii TaxID=2760083 RepID=UPI0015F8C47E|nr:carboxymuconolactone decarboxylase family protein [Tomitella gaofuii]
MSATQRMSIGEVDGGAYKAVLGLQKYVNAGTVGARLRAIVDIRASQINHCAWCLDMHVAEARGAGAPQRQIDLIAAWREAPALFDDRERAALALTEQVTLISEQGVSDEVWSQVRAVFSEQETLELLMTIATINVWNRMNVAVRADLPEQPAVAG